MRLLIPDFCKRNVMALSYMVSLCTLYALCYYPTYIVCSFVTQLSCWALFKIRGGPKRYLQIYDLNGVHLVCGALWPDMYGVPFPAGSLGPEMALPELYGVRYDFTYI